MSTAIIISGASGAGKSTIVEYLINQNKRLQFVVSACTRTKRKNEIDKKDYYFISEVDFKKKIKENKFLEWEEVYPGRYYGTLQADVDNIWKNNKVPIFAVDIQGACQLKNVLKKNVLTIYIKSPHIYILKERLKKRKTEDENSLRMRLKKAEIELTREKDFDYVIMNDILKNSFQQATSIVEEFLK